MPHNLNRSLSDQMCQTDPDSEQQNKINCIQQQLDSALQQNQKDARVIKQLELTCFELQLQLSVPKADQGNQTQQQNHFDQVNGLYNLFQIDLETTKNFINLDQARHFKQALFQKIAAKALDQSISGQFNSLQAENRNLKQQITYITEQFALKQKSHSQVVAAQCNLLRKQINAIRTQLVGTQGEFEFVGQSIQNWGDQLTQKWMRTQTVLYQENKSLAAAYSQQQQSMQEAQQMQSIKLEQYTKLSETNIAELTRLNKELEGKILAASDREQAQARLSEEIGKQNQVLSQKVQWLLKQQQCGSPESGLESIKNLEEGSQILTLQEALTLLQTKTKEWQHVVQRNFDLEKIIDEKDEEILDLMKAQYPTDQQSVQSPVKLPTIAEETSQQEQTEFSNQDQSLDIGLIPPMLSRVQSLLSPEIPDIQIAQPTTRSTMPTQDFDKDICSSDSSEQIQTVEIPQIVDRKKLLLENIFSKLKNNNQTALPQSPISGAESKQLGIDLVSRKVSESGSSNSFYGSNAAQQVAIVLTTLQRLDTGSLIEQFVSEMGSVRTELKSSITESQDEIFSGVQVKGDFWQEVTVQDIENVKKHTTLEEINLVAKPSRMTMPNKQAVTMIEDPFEHGTVESKSGTASFQEEKKSIESVVVEVQSSYFTKNPVTLIDATYGDTKNAEFALRQKLKEQFGEDFFQDESKLMSFAQSKKSSHRQSDRWSGNDQLPDATKNRQSDARGSLAFFSERMESIKEVNEFAEVIVEDRSQDGEQEAFSYIESGGSIILNDSIILSQGNTSN